MSANYINSVLDPERIKLLNELRKIIADGQMAGGTALAILLGHRKSFDFDFFYSSKISSRLLQTINSRFPHYEIRPMIDTKDELSILIDGNIKTTFLHFPFSPLHTFIKISGISLYSFEDQASNKAYAIGRRTEWKDYIDLYALLVLQKLDIEKIVAETKIRFKSNFDEKLFWEKLTYWKDLGNFDITLLRSDISFIGMQDLFQELSYKKFKNFAEGNI